jgi:hypothetical protein
MINNNTKPTRAIMNTLVAKRQHHAHVEERQRGMHITTKTANQSETTHTEH